MLSNLVVLSEAAVTWAWPNDKGPSFMLDAGLLAPYVRLCRGEGNIRLQGQVFVSVEELKAWAEEEGETTVLTKLQIAEQYGDDLEHALRTLNDRRVPPTSDPDFTPMTVHKAKGSEFDHVLLGCDYRLPVDKEGSLLEQE